RTLGEFSWKVENMLNRVLDGTRSASPAVLALVGVAHEALPGLHAALRGEQAVDADLDAIEALADRIAAGEEAFHERTTAAVGAPGPAPAEPDAFDFELAVEPEAQAAGSEPEGMPASVDPVLREILEAEVTGHLQTLEAWLARARSAPTGADDALLRSIHTMNGAFAMTEVPSITDVTTQAEAYARRLLASGQDADADGVDGISGVVDAIRSTIQALALPEPRIPLFTPLVARMAELCDRLPEENQSIFAAGASEA